MRCCTKHQSNWRLSLGSEPKPNAIVEVGLVVVMLLVGLKSSKTPDLRPRHTLGLDRADNHHSMASHIANIPAMEAMMDAKYSLSKKLMTPYTESILLKAPDILNTSLTIPTAHRVPQRPISAGYQSISLQGGTLSPFLGSN